MQFDLDLPFIVAGPLCVFLLMGRDAAVGTKSACGGLSMRRRRRSGEEESVVGTTDARLFNKGDATLLLL